VTVGGTNAGFVTISHQGNTAYQVFVPINASGAPVPPSDAGAPDGGTATYPVLTFSSNATAAHMVSDELGGTGAVLLEPNGASFIYVKADGTSRLATGTVISSADGAQAVISTYRSSFVVSLYENTSHDTKVVSSGCGPWQVAEEARPGGRRPASRWIIEAARDPARGRPARGRPRPWGDRRRRPARWG
jgi:hypothetical protein